MKLKGISRITKEYHKALVVLFPENALNTVLANYLRLDLWHPLGYVFCCLFLMYHE